MKKLAKIVFTGVLLTFTAYGQSQELSMDEVISIGLNRASEQAIAMAQSLENKNGLLPKSIDTEGKLITSDSRWWCSGFFPGELWYLYEQTKDPKLKAYAEMFTDRVEREKYTTDNHDVGFMLYCSFGNGLRVTGTERYKEVLLTGAKSLSTRFNDKIGVIKSWDGHQAKWQYPVIIDNMMNLELLMWTARKSGDKRFERIAKSHADVTIKNHFRSDYSTFHVVSYDTITGLPHAKQTAQGASDVSAWSRGQAWGLYGYTMMYRETGDQRYLDQAKHIASFIINHPKLPADKVPYWDFNAPGIPNVPRDASAAAVMASALIELSHFDKSNFGKQCLLIAEKQVRTLTSPEYLADKGTNGNFLLKHSTGSYPHNSEVDVPLTYADYYYVEALTRLKKYR